MKTLSSFSQLVRLKISVINVILIAAVFIIISLGCGGEPFTKPNAEYFGVWSAKDATLTFRPNGTVEYSSPDLYLRDNDVRIYERLGLHFSLWSYEEGKFKIDSQPSGGKMTLNGITYQKTGNSEPPPSSDKLQIPSDAEIDKLIKDAIGEFIKALEAGNSDQFLAAQEPLATYDKDRFDEDFAAALKNKDKSLASLQDAQTKPINFKFKQRMIITPQSGKFGFDEASFQSQPFPTTVQGSFEFKNGSWRFRYFMVWFK